MRDYCTPLSFDGFPDATSSLSFSVDYYWILSDILHWFKLVPSLRGEQGGRTLSNGCLCPSFRFTQNTVFGTSLNDKTTQNDGKRNNYVQT